jgi:hypothetical protein
MFKDILQRGKCLVGFHQGPWQFSAEKICTKVQICTVCKARTEKPEHNWSEWAAPRPDSCDFQRKCTRCGISESKTEHAWGERQYAADGDCTLQRVCTRCAATEAAGTQHAMDTWTYAADDSCTQKLACSRCGATGAQSRIEHDWNAPTHSKFYGATVAVCGRCGETHVPADGGISLQKAAQAVRALTNADDEAAVIAATRQHSAVLTAPATQHYLKLATERFSVDAALRERLAAAAKFTEVCRTVGVEGALAYFASQTTATQTAAAAGASTAAQQATPAAATTASASSDYRLPGHWRHTEAMSSGGVSMATDTHLVLAADGSAACWNHSCGSFGESRSEKEYGTWRTASGMLYVNAGLSYSGSYTTDGSKLVLPQSGRYRFWEKVR